MRCSEIVFLGFILVTCISAFGRSTPGLPTTKDETVTVALTEATVDIELGPEYVWIESEFVFVNEGPATDVDIYLPFSSDWEYVMADEPDGVKEWLAAEYGVPVSYSEVGGTAYAVYELTEAETDSAAEPGSWDARYKDVISEGDLSAPHPESFRMGFSVTAGDEKPSAGLLTEIKVLLDDLSTADYRTYARFTVSFSAGEKRVVSCRYWSGYFEEWMVIIPPTFSYDLAWGEDWAGPIGDLTVRIKRSLKTVGGPVWFSSPGAVIEVTGDTEVITWELEDYETPGEENVFLHLGFSLSSFGGDRLETFCEGIGVEGGYGVPGHTTVDNLNFRTGPSPDAERVAGYLTLDKDTAFSISEARGEWWRVRLTDGTEGWLRWRYVDPGAGTEHVYAKMFL